MCIKQQTHTYMKLKHMFRRSHFGFRALADMGKNALKGLEWSRLGHNPGLVRLNHGKTKVGDFHTLPCSFLKAIQAQKKTFSAGESVEMAESQQRVAAEEDRKQAPLSVRLAMAALARLRDPMIQQNKDDKVKDVATKENMKQAAASHRASQAGNGCARKEILY